MAAPHKHESLSEQTKFRYTHLAIIAVRRRIHLRASVPVNGLLQRSLNEILNQSSLSQSTKECSFDQLKELRVRCLHIACQVPRQMRHWNDRLHAFHLVVLIALNCQLVLAPGQRTDIPRNVIGPTLGTTV